MTQLLLFFVLTTVSGDGLLFEGFICDKFGRSGVKRLSVTILLAGFF